jgi:hypothetical protein
MAEVTGCDRVNGASAEDLETSNAEVLVEGECFSY